MKTRKDSTAFGILRNITDHKALPVLLLFLCAVFEILLQPLMENFSFILRVNSVIALVTLVLAGILVLLKEVPGIVNRYNADNVELGSIETRTFYITSRLMMTAVVLLTMIMPVVALRAYYALEHISSNAVIGSVLGDSQ